MIRLIEGDCLQVLRRMSSGDVDAVVTDPPWNLGKDYAGHDDAMPLDDHLAWLGDVLAQCARVARGPVVFLPGAHLRERVPELVRRAGVRHVATLTWRKPAPEPVVWCGTPAAKAPRVIVAREPPPGAHPCPKPVALMATLVDAATEPGGVVLDPFAGSGTTLVAAAACGRSAIGIEIDARYIALARLRCGVGTPPP
jgi:DNA modification methylase